MSQSSSPIDSYVLLATAHVAMLGKQGLIDDAAVRILASVIDRVGAMPFDGNDPHRLLLDFDDRVDSQSPPGFAGAARVGRGVNEMVAGYARVAVRNRLLDTARHLVQLRDDVVDLAIQHVVTIMPAYQQGLAAQPTTLAHFLGGVIGPLGRSMAQIQSAYGVVNRSPLGANALVSTGLPIDREASAAYAGFDGIIENTFDAVAAVDHFGATVDAITSVALPIRRLVHELETLYRTDPSVLLLHEAGLEIRSELPQLAVVPAFADLALGFDTLDAHLDAAERWLRRAPLEPFGSVGSLMDHLDQAFASLRGVMERFSVFINREIAFNRAYLANRANRNYATIGELTDYLMLEEQIGPAPARNVTARVLAQLREQGLETSGITSEMIDSAAMLVVGRELGIEFESLSKYLAPRRFIERRAGIGGPAPVATRAWLTKEKAALEYDRAWIDERQAAIEAVVRERAALAQEGTD